MDANRSHLDALKMRVAHQDATIEELSAALTIETLRRKVAALSEVPRGSICRPHINWA